MAQCIVCGKEFDESGPEAFRQSHEGKWYRFNDIGCRNRFLGNPEKYLNPQAAQT